MAWSLYLRNDGNASLTALGLDVIEFFTGVGLVGTLVQACDRGVVGPESKCGISVMQAALPRVLLDIVINVVAEMHMERVLLEERQIRTHLDQEIRRIEVATGIKLLKH